VALDSEASGFEGGGRFVETLRGDHDVHVARDQWFGSPVVDRQPADHAPRNLPAIQRVRQPPHIARAAAGLPFKKKSRAVMISPVLKCNPKAVDSSSQRSTPNKT
jgi:hypothetical protein